MIIRSSATGSRTIVNSNTLDEMTLEEFALKISELIEPVTKAEDLSRNRASGWHIHFEVPSPCRIVPGHDKSCLPP